MKQSFYLKMAISNVRKNRRLYLPQMMTGSGLVAMFYILFTLASDERLSQVRGGSYLPTIMPMGMAIVGILSVILIFYTNSFLMKQRKREFGLYNVLGLEKRHIGRIYLRESGIAAMGAVISGLVLGILMYKVCALLICRILNVDSVLGFYHVSLSTIIPSAAFFLAVYLIAYVVNRIQISRMNPVELLQSTHTGEKEPKIKWLLLIAGILSLGGGYVLALTTENPLDALNLFFIAVLLVILGTYCLFVTGSIALLKFLKKRQKFYYHPRHMISVSGLMYRMKQNAMGLASISILATMVLVMLSTTVSMYAGIKDTLVRAFPHDFYISAYYDTTQQENREIPLEDVSGIVHRAAERTGIHISQENRQTYFSCGFNKKDGQILSTDTSEKVLKLMQCFFVTAEEYERLTGQQVWLQENEIAVFSQTGNATTIRKGNTWVIGENSYTCTRELASYPINMAAYTLVDCYGVVVSDDTVFSDLFRFQKKSYGKNSSEITNQMVFDFTNRKAVEEVYDDFTGALSDEIGKYVEKQADSTGSFGSATDSVWEATEGIYGMYGTLLFLGVILAIVFLFATALIIYYKQISEGYEDRERFRIMQNVGMSNAEVKGTIRSQILLVFFLPLLVAALHMGVAFPMLTKLLKILFLSSKVLFFWCTVGALAAFVIIYICIFSITANVYYRIVSEQKY